jgi:hypothetical protein
VLAVALPQNTGKEYYYDTQPNTSQLIWPQGTQPSAAFSQVVADLGFLQVKSGQAAMRVPSENSTTQRKVLPLGSPAPPKYSDNQPKEVKRPDMKDYEEVLSSSMFLAPGVVF